MCFKQFLRFYDRSRSDFVPEVDFRFKLDIKVYFTLINVKKILKTYKMYMKTLIYLISSIRYLILAVKG